MCHKNKLKFEECKHCLEATQLENEINQLEKNKFDVDNLRKNHKKFIKKNNKLILKSQQRFRSEKHDIITEEVNRIALIASDDKRIQLINSIGACAYGVSKELIRKNEEIKCSKIMKKYQND